jgi:hypothetical protein
VRVTSSLPLVSCALADETYKRVTLQKGKQDYLRAGRISGEGEAFCEMLVRGKKGDKLALSATHPRAVKAGADIVLP